MSTFRAFGKVEERPGALVADLLLELFRPPPLAGAELPAIAPRCSVAEAVGIDQDGRNAGPGQMMRGLQPGIAAADDGDVASPRAVESGIGRPLADG
jgi:hypothetical protein